MNLTGKINKTKQGPGYKSQVPVVVVVPKAGIEPARLEAIGF
jgi:hypothetical protein